MMQKENHNISSENDRVLYRSQFIDGILDSIGFGAFQFAAFLMVGITFFALSFDYLTLTFVSLKVSSTWNLSSVQYGAVPAATCLANLLGEVSFGILSDRYGRIWPYVVSVGITGVFVLASAFARSFALFVSLRGLASYGIGGMVNIAYPTLLELLPVGSRSSAGVLIGFVQAFGCCATGGLAWWIIPSYPNGWRYFIIITSIPTFAAMIFRLVFHVESPYYLISHRKFERAWTTLALIAKLTCKDIDDIVDKNHFDATLNIQGGSCGGDDYFTKPKSKRHTHMTNLITIFKPPFLHRTVCLTLIYLLYNLAYYGSVYFLPKLAQNLNLPEYLITFGSFSAQIPGTALMAIVINWRGFGHRNTLRYFLLGNALFYFLFAFVQYKIPVAVFIILVYFFMTPIGFQLFTYMSGSYPANIRATAFGFNMVIFAINGMWLPFVSGYMADISLHYPWLSPAVWGCVLVLTFIVTLFLNHETCDQDSRIIIN